MKIKQPEHIVLKALLLVTLLLWVTYLLIEWSRRSG